MLPSLGAAGTLLGRVSHFVERTSHWLPQPFSVDSGPHCLVISGFSGRSPVCSCHMLDFTQTGFGNSPMTLSQSPLKPDYPNQPSCLLKENLALESVFYKDTNHRTKKSINFFLNRLDLPDKKGPNHIIILVQSFQNHQKNFEPWHRQAWQSEWRHWLSWSVEDIQRQEAHQQKNPPPPPECGTFGLEL